MLDASQISKYQHDGYCILDNVITSSQAEEIIEVAERLAEKLIKQVLNLPAELLEPEEVSRYSNFLKLVRFSRPDAGRVFDALIKIPLVNQIVFSEKLQYIAERILQTDLALSSPSQMNLRADHPDEGKFLYPWHNDYSYNGSSSNSLVFWIPLQETDLVNGALHIIPGSHHFSSKIRYDDDAIKAKRSADYFFIENINDALARYGELRCCLKLGQAVVFHSKLVHKSGANQSGSTRYALQSRWFDGASNEAINLKYVGGLDEGVHPSYYL